LSENPPGAKDADVRFERRVTERGKLTEIFYDADADPRRLDGRTVAVVGYGIQGRVQALNMCDSGVENIAVGSVRDESWERAEADGFSPVPIREAVERADISFLLVPGEVATAVYEEHVEPVLGSGKTQRSGEPVLEELMERVSQHPIVEAEKRLRNMLGNGSRKEE
jgi:ketol-acid reductoisomerase